MCSFGQDDVLCCFFILRPSDLTSATCHVAISIRSRLPLEFGVWRRKVQLILVISLWTSNLKDTCAFLKRTHYVYTDISQENALCTMKLNGTGLGC